MPRSKLIQARNLSAGETIFLNDTKARDAYSAYYLDLTMLNRQYNYAEGTVHVGQVLEILDHQTLIQVGILSIDGRVVDFECDPAQSFLVCEPEQKTVEDLERGDEILMRGDFNPARWSSTYAYTVIAAREGYSSTVLKVRKRFRGDFKLTVKFAGMKKFRFTVDAGTTFEISPV